MADGLRAQMGIRRMSAQESAHEGDVAQLLRVRALVRGELRVQIRQQIQRTSSTGRRGDFARPCGSPGKDPRFRAADRRRPVDNL